MPTLVARPSERLSPGPAHDATLAAPRRELRRQISDLERRLSETVVTTFAQRAEPLDPAAAPPARRRAPRVLTLGELEALRDELAARLVAAQAHLTEVGLRQERARERLERMLREPHRHKFARVGAVELGDGGCGVWQVRPRLGLVGMLAGWWEVKLSSGCPRPA
jgi:hypothetical protein